MAKKLRINVTRTVSIQYAGEHPRTTDIELLIALGQPSSKAHFITDGDAKTLTALWVEDTKVKFTEDDKDAEPVHLDAETTFGFSGPYEGDIEI